MNYKDTLQYLYEQLPMFHRIGAAAYKANLDNTLAISSLLGQPEQNFPSIHIAGTNGKGSTSHMLASILQEAGYKTGLFTSPHLKDFRERIRINGKMISQQSVIRFVEAWQNPFSEIQPSFFEWTFALATDHFSREKIDIAVMETGMGGRLDSTNIVKPVLTIITNIGYDHMQFLGDTLAKIASEKAGIIKQGIPLVVGETQDETKEVFITAAKNLQADITFADHCFTVIEHQPLIPGKKRIELSILENGQMHAIRLSCPLTGRYQLKNLLTVMQAVTRLRQSGFMIPSEAVTRGISRVIKNTGLKGRWQVISKQPVTIADISHNKDGIRETMSHFGQQQFNKLHVVLGVVNDKDVDAMLALLPAEARYYFCKANIPRGLDASVLAEKAKTRLLNGEVYPDVGSALKAAQLAAGIGEIVIVTGSAFVVAEIV